MSGLLQNRGVASTSYVLRVRVTSTEHFAETLNSARSQATCNARCHERQVKAIFVGWGVFGRGDIGLDQPCDGTSDCRSVLSAPMSRMCTEDMELRRAELVLETEDPRLSVEQLGYETVEGSVMYMPNMGGAAGQC